MAKYVNVEWALGAASSGIIKTIDGERWIRCKEVKESVKEAPDFCTIEVVRCKECKWRYHQDETDWTYEGWYCRIYEASVKDDGFCDRGERKEKVEDAKIH